MAYSRSQPLKRSGAVAVYLTVESGPDLLNVSSSAFDAVDGAHSYSSGATGGGRKIVSGIQSLARRAFASSRSTCGSIVC
jgi:hypothetical protein